MSIPVLSFHPTKLNRPENVHNWQKNHECRSWQLQQLSPVIPPICFVSFQFIVSFPFFHLLIQTAPLNLSASSIPLVSSVLSILLIPFSHNFHANIPLIPLVLLISQLQVHQFHWLYSFLRFQQVHHYHQFPPFIPPIPEAPSALLIIPTNPKTPSTFQEFYKFCQFHQFF